MARQWAPTARVPLVSEIIYFHYLPHLRVGISFFRTVACTTTPFQGQGAPVQSFGVVESKYLIVSIHLGVAYRVANGVAFQ